MSLLSPASKQSPVEEKHKAHTGTERFSQRLTNEQNKAWLERERREKTHCSSRGIAYAIPSSKRKTVSAVAYTAPSFTSFWNTSLRLIPVSSSFLNFLGYEHHPGGPRG
jgi:hypothetical protein